VEKFHDALQIPEEQVVPVAMNAQQEVTSHALDSNNTRICSTLLESEVGLKSCVQSPELPR
jgi:hypothetical protein